jgi:hypothetical protein
VLYASLGVLGQSVQSIVALADPTWGARREGTATVETAASERDIRMASISQATDKIVLKARVGLG